MSASNTFKLVTFNVLAPCYNKVGPGKYENATVDEYMHRNRLICEKLLQTNADIICLQEFWTQNEDLYLMYKTMLCDKGGYEMRSLRRTSHWRSREDGLAMFVLNRNLEILDTKDILFHDCGDRVAQLLLLGLRDFPHVGFDSSVADSTIPTDESYRELFLCVNTHLLFPHNSFSTKIRVREMSKILDFVEAYRQTELCRDICGRSDVRLPVVLAGWCYNPVISAYHNKILVSI